MTFAASILHLSGVLISTCLTAHIRNVTIDNSFVLIVDDWNWRQVRLGTLKAILDAKLSILSSIEVRTSFSNVHPRIQGKESDWHNGYYIAVIERAG